MEATANQGPVLVGLTLEGPRPMRRLTVAFRLILAIPHFLWAILLIIAGFFVAIVAWFAALFTGRLPDGLADFLGQLVQYNTRLTAYLYLLTDKYPPFSISDADYPVSVILPPRGKLNRAAVLFRIILSLPAGIAISVLTSGLQLALVVIWLIVLIAGRLPNAAFEAEAAVLRYEVRYYAWFVMLTSTYPKGLYGDRPAAESPEVADLEAAADQPPAEPLSTLPPPPGAPTTAPRITRIVLSKAGKRLVVVFIVLGVLLTAGQIVVAIVSGGQSERALRNLDEEYREVVNDSQEYGVAIQGCGLSGGAACLQTANQDLANGVREFRADLVAEDFPEYALDDAEDLRDAADQLIAVLEQMALTTEPDAYSALVTQFQAAANQMDEEYSDLRETLRLGF